MHDSDVLRTYVYVGLGCLDIITSLVLLACMQVITKDAGWSDSTARWSLFRRVVYVLVWLAFFALGVQRIERPRAIEFWEAVPQIVIVFYVLIFPVLRATKIITQDHWVIKNGLHKTLDQVIAGRKD